MDPVTIILVFGAMISLIVVAFTMLSCYRRCGPDQAMIITGLMEQNSSVAIKIVRRGGSVVLPILQQVSYLNLDLITVDVSSQLPVVSTSGLPVLIEGAAEVKIKDDDQSIATAAEYFLSKSYEEIVEIVRQVLVGHLRAAVGKPDLQELMANLPAFNKRVEETASADLQKMGLTILAFTITRVNDGAETAPAFVRQETSP